MNRDEALAKLELEEGATSSEINAQYQEFYNEFQMRITNSPTEHQRKLYQKKLEELTEAFEVLGGENQESNTQELPGIAESEIDIIEKHSKSSSSYQDEMSKEKALQILGLGEKFTEKELAKAFQTKVSGFENGRENAVNTSIQVGYEEAIIECNSAYNLLKDYIFIAPPVVKVARPSTQASKDNSATKKKWGLPVSIASGVIIVIILFFAFGNGSSNTDEHIDPATHDKYVSLKSQADLLVKQGNWQEALTMYEKAYTLDKKSAVNDSIISMKNHLLSEAIEKEAESKRIKIGDVYAGGIVFNVDTKGEHGLVCTPKDQGKYLWDEADLVCQKLTLNGFSDWYLPSKAELHLMYTKIGGGSSLGNVGVFTNNYYWSSTHGTGWEINTSWAQHFLNGKQKSYAYGFADSYEEFYVRAVRAF